MHHSELIITGSDGKTYEGAARQAILLAYLQEGRLPAEVQGVPDFAQVDWSGFSLTMSDDAKLVLGALDMAVNQLRAHGQLRTLQAESMQLTPHPALLHFEMREYGLRLYSRLSDSVGVRISGVGGLDDTGVQVECSFSSRGSCPLAEQIERCNAQLVLLNTASSVEALLTFVYNSLGEQRIGKVLVELAAAQEAVHVAFRKALAAQ